MPLRLMTKRKKAWFFPLCDYQPKINKLIFLIFLTNRLAFLLSPEDCQQSLGHRSALDSICKNYSYSLIGTQEQNRLRSP
ncbi:hypothetical protein F3J27_19740 [Enterobacter sp. Ap-916]|nr:hypothetical protein [Enterobacter sp. Ap-1006]NIF60306.1 hypothetical protein [Enterobacter sp. Ap-867]NIG31713.1 hypothetical protein [Enterobacter sp. Ap-916]